MKNISANTTSNIQKSISMMSLKRIWRTSLALSILTALMGGGVFASTSVGNSIQNLLFDDSSGIMTLLKLKENSPKLLETVNHNSTFSIQQSVFDEQGKDPSLSTDKIDYQPGEMVSVTGSNWQPGETIIMVLSEEPTTHEAITLTSVADENGNFTNTNFSPDLHDLGVKFTLRATGQSSGKTAQVQFTDSHTTISTGLSTDYVISKSNGAAITPGTNPLSIYCDDCTTLTPLPFDYNLYGATFPAGTNVVVGSNGYIQFQSNYTTLGGCAPFSSTGNYSIYAYHADLLAYGNIYTSVTGSAPNRVFNIEWRNVGYWATSGAAHFQIRLFEGQQRFDIIYGQISHLNWGSAFVQRSQTSYTNIIAVKAG